ncbi:MAG: tetratricopeptide repeat protein [Succinivibrio sp.]
MLLTEQNAKEVLIEGSMNKAVFLYFFMEAPECEEAGKALRAAISESNEYVSLVEANVKDQVAQAVAMQLGLQSVPALIVMKQGQPVEALQGDDIVANLANTLKKYMPSQSELLIKQAREAEASGDLSNAIVLAKQAYSLEENDLSAKLVYADLCIKNRDLETAHRLLDNPGREEQNMQDYKDLISALTLAEQAAESPEIKELEAKFRENPNDSQIATTYAAALCQAGKKGTALEILFEILKKDLSNDEVKKTFLDMLNTMSGDPLQKEFRRKLYTLMY